MIGKIFHCIMIVLGIGLLILVIINNWAIFSPILEAVAYIFVIYIFIVTYNVK